MTHLTMRWLVASLAAFTLQSAFAQLEDTGAPPPWNKRFDKCSHPLVHDFTCDFDPWKTSISSQEQFRGAARRGEFAKLEADLRLLAGSDGIFSDRLYKGSVVYSWIREVVQNERRTGQPPGVREVLARWRAAVPDSQFVLLADALRLHDQAWDARGNGFASTVSPQAWELFAERLGAAEARLLQAQAWMQQTQAWNEIMLIVAQDARGVRTDWRQQFAEAAKRWPRDLRIYTLVANRLHPKWGGSWEDIDAFSDAAAKNTQPTEGRSFYARIYSRLGDALLEHPEAVHWRKLKPAFHDWLQRSPDQYTKNRYASFACFARDKAAFKDAMAHIPASDWYAEPWLDGYTLETCRLWAAKP
jgi:hypothetical protein